ncbi:MAG: hypothetical protein PVH64_01990 [Bacillota bacterium]
MHKLQEKVSLSCGAPDCPDGVVRGSGFVVVVLHLATAIYGGCQGLMGCGDLSGKS